MPASAMTTRGARPPRPPAAHGRTPTAARRPLAARAAAPDAAPTLDEVSARYTEEMNARMQSSLAYDHSLGTRWTDLPRALFPRVSVGSCPQAPADVARIAGAGFGAIVSLQQGADLDHFGIDGPGLREAARENGVAHFNVPVADFNPASLRVVLPDAAAVLEAALRATEAAGKRVYVHCTAGLGRAPATVLAHAAWYGGLPLEEAAAAFRAARPCNPRLAAVRAAAADLVLGAPPSPAMLTVRRSSQGNARDATWAVAGLDAGWDARLPLPLDAATGRRTLTRRLVPGRHEFKLVVSASGPGEESEESWVAWPDFPTVDNGAGGVNNFLEVPYPGVLSSAAAVLAERRLTRGDPSEADLTAIRAALASRSRAAVRAAADPAAARWWVRLGRRLAFWRRA